MIISVDPFSYASVQSTSRDTLDDDNLLYAVFTVGIPIPNEGAINFNMTTVDNLYLNSAGWPYDLGFGIPQNS